MAYKIAGEVTLCPIWGTVATRYADAAYDGTRLCSHRGGGRFDITGSAYPAVQNLSKTEKIKLSRWIYEQNSLGATPEITSRISEQVSLMTMHDAQQRADMLLKFIAYETLHIGAVVSLDFDMPLTRNEALALAASQSDEPGEVTFLCKYLERRGWIDVVRTYDHHDITLNVDGHVRLSQLVGVLSGSAQAFVAMWFNEDTASAYTDGIAPAVLSCGFSPLRIDKKETIQKVDDEIIAEIRASRFVVADFTSLRDRPRGGVYFEAGFAMGLNKPVIWMCREDLVDQLHFDTRQFSHICWTTPEDVKVKLANRILAVIGRGSLKSP